MLQLLQPRLLLQMMRQLLFLLQLLQQLVQDLLLLLLSYRSLGGQQQVEAK